MPLYSLDGMKVATPASGRFFIAPNATLIGQVEIAEDVSIWFNAVLRGDNEPIRIGARSNIQDGTVLHTDPGFPIDIAPDVLVGHMALVHGCTIETGALIGMGAIVLNGARIGAGSLVGAGALVPEGKIIPPRSLVVGSPGKVVRQLSDEDVARIKQGVDKYVGNGARYRKGLAPQA